MCGSLDLPAARHNDGAVPLLQETRRRFGCYYVLVVGFQMSGNALMAVKAMLVYIGAFWLAPEAIPGLPVLKYNEWVSSTAKSRINIPVYT